MKDITEKVNELILKLDDAEKSNNLMYCQKLIQDIITLYNENNENKVFKDDIQKYKEKLIIVNKKLPEQFKTFTQTLEIKNELVDALVDSIVSEKNYEKLIKKLYSPFEIKSSELKDISTKNTPIFLELVSMNLIDDKWNNLKTWKDNYNYWYYQNYQLYQWYYWSFFWIVFNKLFEKEYFNEDFLLEIFRSKFLFPSISSYNKFEVWIEMFCKWDFVSSLHILVPLFEEIFLYVSNSLWIDTIWLWRAKEVITQTKTLSSDMLNTEIFKTSYWENYIQHIDFILFHELWYKLRHKIAHWNINFVECNFNNISLILYLYFWLWSRINITSWK